MNRIIRIWIKENLFNTWYNAVISVLLVYFLGKAAISLSMWFFSVQWQVIPENLKLILTGAYPSDQLGRIWALLLIASLLAGLSFSIPGGGLGTAAKLMIAAPLLLALLPFETGSRITLAALSLCQTGGYMIGRYLPGRKKASIVAVGWVLYVPLIYIVVSGFTGPEGILPSVATNLWGGLLLSLLISITSILLSFILGLFLALGRRSDLKVIKIFCVAVIEIIRGVPLITLLFLGYLILPLALPAGLTIGVLTRAMAGIVLFHAAYMAENIRGGFQGLSKTQYEAAYAMNFNKFQSMVLIILPQVIKNIIPVLVNSFTGMVKDTSLISIIGLLDLVGISTAIAANPAFMSDSQQVLLFLSAIYFVLCFSISKASRKIEASMTYER